MAKFDELYDKLVKLRDAMGKKLGYEGYTTLGYYRMVRNCYTKEDVETFRAAVVKYLVPVADKVYREQAKRLGKSYPMSFADNALEFRSGNPRPVGTPKGSNVSTLEYNHPVPSAHKGGRRSMLLGNHYLPYNRRVPW